MISTQSTGDRRLIPSQREALGKFVPNPFPPAQTSAPAPSVERVPADPPVGSAGAEPGHEEKIISGPLRNPWPRFLGDVSEISPSALEHEDFSTNPGVDLLWLPEKPVAAIDVLCDQHDASCPDVLR